MTLYMKLAPKKGDDCPQIIYIRIILQISVTKLTEGQKYRNTKNMDDPGEIRDMKATVV